MIPADFEYRRPGSVKEATALLAAGGDAKVLAGGMSLIPALKHRMLQPQVLVDIGELAELEARSERRGELRIGARVTHAALARDGLGNVHALREAAQQIGDVQVRNRGTLGGSLVHADPAADWPAVFLALDGEAVLVGPRGERSVSSGDFFTGMLATAVEPDELLVEVRLSVERKRSGTAYAKMRQAASGFAVVGVAARVAVDRRGRCESARVGVAGVNPVPFRARSVEERLVGRALDDAALADALVAVEEADPLGDLHASAEYRAHLLGVFARRALTSAYARAMA